MLRRVALGLLTLIMVVALAGCSTSAPSYTIKYSVTGTATKVSITYLNDAGGVSQVSEAAPPWSTQFSGAKSSQYVSVIATNLNNDSGTITVTIEKDGSVFKTATSSGPFASASASGILP